jgi:hypothetical protein
MKNLKLTQVEAAFILLFGVFHFTLPFLLPPNFTSNTTILGGLRIADFVVPGVIAVGVCAIFYFWSKNHYPAALLAFLYAGGITFHVLYIAGLFPSVLRLPSPFISVAGIIVDVLSILAIYDYYHRIHGFVG